MSRSFFFIYFILLVTLSLANIKAYDYDYDYDYDEKPNYLVQVVHNHGARLPIMPHNQTYICSRDNVCGELKDDKIQSIENAANLLKDFLKTLPDKGKALTDTYMPFNSTEIHSRSTDELATLQSSFKFFSQLPLEHPFFPPTHTKNLEEDQLLNPKASPALYLQYKYGMPEIRAACNPLLAKYNLTSKILQRLAKEVKYEGYCSDKEKGVDCAVSLCDIGSSLLYTQAVNSPFPALLESLDGLCKVSVCVSNFTLGYDSNNTLHKLQGSKGQPLAQELLKNMHDFLDNKSNVKLHAYSVSSDAIASLAITLGYNSEETLHPAPGMAFLFSLTNNSDSPKIDVYATYFDRFQNRTRNIDIIRKGHISKVIRWVQLHPTNFSDFKKLVEASAPSSKEGLCYLDPVLKERMGCPVTPEELTSHASGKDCLFYQKQCSEFIIPNKTRLSFPTYAYYLTNFTLWKTEQVGLSAGAIAAVIIAACIVGSVLGLLISYIRRWCKVRSDKNEYFKLYSA